VRGAARPNRADNPNLSMEKPNDPLYDEVRTQVLDGEKHLPYDEYLEKRTLYYIRKVASASQLEKLQEAITERMT